MSRFLMSVGHGCLGFELCPSAAGQGSDVGRFGKERIRIADALLYVPTPGGEVGVAVS